MTDAQRTSQATSTSSDPITTLLYVVLVISVVGNTVTSFGGVSVILHAAIGTVTLVCIGLLVARRLGRS